MYTWTFGNNVSYSSGSPLITVKCTTLGLHSVRLAVTNCGTTMNSSIEYHVVKHGNLPIFSHPSSALLEEPVLFILKVSGPLFKHSWLREIHFHLHVYLSVCAYTGFLIFYKYSLYCMFAVFILLFIYKALCLLSL